MTVIDRDVRSLYLDQIRRDLTRYGMEQLVRDCRITQIYEGTNGIQALDLVGRKAPAHLGRYLRRFFHPVQQFLEQEAVNPEMEEFVAPVAKAFERLQRATGWLGQESLKNPDQAGAVASEYLHLFGYVAFGYLWARMAKVALAKRGGEKNLTKSEICEGGMVFWYSKTHNWTSCAAVGALRGLWEMESDAELKSVYAKGLVASAKLASEALPLAQKWDNADTSPFEMNWRVMNAEWKPQTTEKEAPELAMVQIKSFLKVAPRRGKETAFIREPTAAAWIVTLCPDAAVLKAYAPEVEKVITRYDFAKLYYSQFFWVEMAWERLKDRS